jgi:3-oxosteroid 1-dehydrogenase
VAEVQDFDVICVGAGLGGLSAAIAAYEMGMRPLIVEKSDLVGGVTALSGGQVWVPGNDLEAELGIADSPDDGATYIERISAGTADSGRLRALLREAPDAARYFARHTGMQWSVCNLPDYYSEVAGGRAIGRYLEAQPFPGAGLGGMQPITRLAPMYPERLTWNELIDCWQHGRPADPRLHHDRLAADVRVRGAALMAWFVHAAAERGIDILTGARLPELIYHPAPDTRVTGVEVTLGDTRTRLKARRGVILATGGHDWASWLTNPPDQFARSGSAAHAQVEGDHLVLAGMLGARTAYSPSPKLFGFQAAGERDADGHPAWRVVTPQSHSILVNRHSRRFCDETHYIAINQALRTIDGRLQERINDPMFLIADSHYLQNTGLGGLTSAGDLPEVVVQAATIGELAAQLGLDPASLAKEISRFNSAATAGFDPDFHRGENSYERKFLPLPNGPADAMGSISEGPFVGVRLWPVGIGIASTGLVADANGQLINWRDEPMKGLYATGNSLALLETGLGYQSGFANMRGMTYGYLAARHMAGSDG